MICPECGHSEVRTLDVRTYRDPQMDFHYVERKRRCPACEHKFRTIEVNLEVWAKILNGEIENG